MNMLRRRQLLRELRDMQRMHRQLQQTLDRQTALYYEAGPDRYPTERYERMVRQFEHVTKRLEESMETRVSQLQQSPPRRDWRFWRSP